MFNLSGAPKKIRIDEEDQEYIGKRRGEEKRRTKSHSVRNEQSINALEVIACMSI